jgi:hypothetical protein
MLLDLVFYTSTQVNQSAQSCVLEVWSPVMRLSFRNGIGRCPKLVHAAITVLVT